MSEFPRKTCEIESLVTHPKLVEATLAGRKTQQRRNGVYGYPGETFQLDDQKFVIKDLRREVMSDMTDSEAQAEGYPSLEMYLDLIRRMHKGMDLKADAKVWVHEFERCTE